MSDLVPEGWNSSPLGDVLNKILDFRGRTPKKLGMTWGGGNIRALSANNVQMGKVNFQKECYLASLELYQQWMTKGETEKGDVLFTMEAPLGNVALVPNDDKYILSQRVILLKNDRTKVLSDFLFQQMRSDSFQNVLRENATGSTALGIQQKRLVTLDVVLPPLPEQKKIAAILTSVDDVIEKIQAQIDKLKDLKTGMIQELLTLGVGVDGKPHTEFKDSPVGRIPKSWEVVNVGSLVDVIDPQPDHRTPPEVENGIPYVGLGDIDKSGVINFSGARKVSQAAFDKQCKSFDLHKGAFVFGKIGTIGNPSILPEQRFYCLSANVVLITGVNYEVLRYIFQVFTSDIINEQIAQQTNTTSQPALGIKKVRDFLVPLPTHSEMKIFVNALSSIDKRLTVVKTKLDKLKSSKKALMQDLLTGKVRVKVDSEC